MKNTTNNTVPLKTSLEWQKLSNIIILDADGWDRTPEGWQYSWYEEKITATEFEKRSMISTCITRGKSTAPFWKEENK